jgi:hypothetical protein
MIENLAAEHKIDKVETARSWVKDFKNDHTLLDKLRQKCSNPKSARGHGFLYLRVNAPLSYPQEVDFEIAAWIHLQRQNSLPLTIHDVQDFALERIKPHNPQFKASHKWCTLFFNRHGLSLRQPTDKAPQQLPIKWENCVMEFARTIRHIKEEHDIQDEFIINMDETPLFYEYLARKTIAVKGQKSVAIWKHGYEKKMISLILTITAAGGLLPPSIILHRKTEYKLKCRNKIGLTCFSNEESAWMNEVVMLQYLNQIIFPYVKDRPGIIIFDSYAAHYTENVMNSISTRSKLFVALIPGGLTSKLQPLDVAFNKPYKDLIKEKSHEHYNLRSKESVLKWAKEMASDKRLNSAGGIAIDAKKRLISTPEIGKIIKQRSQSTDTKDKKKQKKDSQPTRKNTVSTQEVSKF